MTAHRRLIATLVLASLSVATPWPSLALAGEAEDKAVALRAEGNRLMDERRYEDAIARFEEALRLTPQEPALYYNLARVHDVRGDAVRALENMDVFLARAPADLKARVTGLDALAESMRRKVARVRIVCRAPTTTSGAAVLARALIMADQQVIAIGCGAHDVRLRAGTTSLRAEAEGYVGRSMPVELQGGETKSVTLDLAPRDTSGLVRLKTTPQHVNVSIGGADVGQTPLELVLPAGSHTLQLTQPGYEDVSLPVVLTANSTRELDAKLEKTPSIVSRWWFWTGIGVAVAAGVGIGIALSTERDPDRGSIEPRVARFPLSRF